MVEVVFSEGKWLIVLNLYPLDDSSSELLCEAFWTGDRWDPTGETVLEFNTREEAQRYVNENWEALRERSGTNVGHDA